MERPQTRMNFASVLKGRVAESILIALLERSGYRVTRLGVEVLFDEVKHLAFDEYQRLGLPHQFRSLPDLLVADAEIEHAYLVEVKFRRCFDVETARELSDTLKRQREHWPDAYAVIMIAESAHPTDRFHQDYIRVLPLKAVELLTSPFYDQFEDEAFRMQTMWDHMKQLQDIFRYFHQGKGNERRGGQGQRNADFITSALRDLRNLG